MKNLILATVVSSAIVTPAFAFFNDGSNTGAFVQDSIGDVKGNGNAEGEATFSMSFMGKGRTAGDFTGNGNMNTNAGNEYRPTYYGRTAPYYNFPAEEK